MKKENATWTEKLYAIVEAARKQNFTDEIDDIEMLSYTETDERGNVKTWEDRFDYIDTTTIPITVRFIGGTGYKKVSCGIGNLTQESIDILYKCIND